MKKLILGFAALAAATTFAEITSANIVGYNQKETESSGKTMLSPSFISVSSEDSFALSDITVNGYDPEDGAWGEFMLATLDSAGRNDQRFFWFDNEDNEPGWYDANGSEKIDGSKITFPAGQAFWTSGEGMTAQFAGQVNLESVAFATPTSGKVSIGNPYPVELKLLNLWVDGYDTDDGAWGEFMLATLDAAGRNDQRYFWFDNEENVAGWWDANGEEPVDAEKVPVPACQGYRVSGEGYTLHFDALSITK